MINFLKKIINIFISSLGPLVVALMIVIILFQTGKAGNTTDEEGLKILENSIQRAVISCYATEGVYPPSISYIKEKYGTIIDDEKYVVYYNIFADNIMPEITVIRAPRDE